MNLDETDEELAARVDMAAALQRLGHALVGHRLDVAIAAQVTAAARQLTTQVVSRPSRDRAAELAASPRVMNALSGRPRALVGVDGGPMDLFRDSIVSGRTNPMGMGIEVRRVEDTVVATTTLGPAFEGAPGRVHGGVIAAIIDELMGFVLPLIGEIAYTANLSIDYIAPAPLQTELTITAALRDRAERKLWIEATGRADDRVFVRAEGLFLTVDLAEFSRGLTT